MRTACFSILILFAVLFPLHSQAGFWNEIGDAGDRLSPQVTVGDGPLEAIFGSLGDTQDGVTDNVDAFLFRITEEGSATITATFIIPSLSFSTAVAVADPALTLFNEAGEQQGSVGSGSISFESLAVGTYIIKVATDLEFDPPYTIQFDAFATFAVPVVPEPVSMLALGSGAVALFSAVARRRYLKSATKV